jgi:hypothetical protein
MDFNRKDSTRNSGSELGGERLHPSWALKRFHRWSTGPAWWALGSGRAAWQVQGGRLILVLLWCCTHIK